VNASERVKELRATRFEGAVAAWNPRLGAEVRMNGAAVQVFIALTVPAPDGLRVLDCAKMITMNDPRRTVEIVRWLLSEAIAPIVEACVLPGEVEAANEKALQFMSRSKKPDLDALRALTIHDPYATAVALGWKPVENRKLAPPRHLLDKLWGIHAAVAPMRQEAVTFVRQLTGKTVDSRELHPGHIIGVGRLAGWVQMVGAQPYLCTSTGDFLLGEKQQELLRRLGKWWTRSLKGWLWEEMVALREPQMARSLNPDATHQGPWRIHPITADNVLRQWMDERRAGAPVDLGKNFRSEGHALRHLVTATSELLEGGG